MRMRCITAEELLQEPFPIVLQTTAAGMYPDIDTLPVYNEAFYRQIRYAADMVFNPLESAFCRKVREYGGFSVGGLFMLFYQGLRSYEIWTGKNFKEKEKKRMHARFQLLAKRRLSNE